MSGRPLRHGRLEVLLDEPLMSSWQPPQPVPARVAPDTSASVPHPDETAAAMAVPLTPAHGPLGISPSRSTLVRAVHAQQQRPVRRELGATDPSAGP